MTSSNNEAPELTGVATSPTNNTSRNSQRKSGKRISELQKKFMSSTDSKSVDAKEVSVSRESTMKKRDEYEVREWLEKQVVASRDF
jgi:hypothetical protein